MDEIWVGVFTNFAKKCHKIIIFGVVLGQIALIVRFARVKLFSDRSGPLSGLRGKDRQWASPFTAVMFADIFFCSAPGYLGSLNTGAVPRVPSGGRRSGMTVVNRMQPATGELALTEEASLGCSHVRIWKHTTLGSYHRRHGQNGRRT